MGSSDERRLRAVVEQITARAGFDLEDLTVQAAGRRRIVRVVIDSDDGVSLDDAADVSRAISAALDADQDDPMGSAPYALEVTSPGIGRPLTLPRHFRRARTRLLAITTTDGRALTGHLLEASDSGVVLLTGKSGTDRIDVPFVTITKARVEVEFSPPSPAVRDLLGITDTDVTDDPAVDGDSPGSDSPGSDSPGSDSPGSDSPGSDSPGSDSPGSDSPGSDLLDSDLPGSDLPGSDLLDSDLLDSDTFDDELAEPDTEPGDGVEAPRTDQEAHR